MNSSNVFNAKHFIWIGSIVLPAIFFSGFAYSQETYKGRVIVPLDSSEFKLSNITNDINTNKIKTDERGVLERRSKSLSFFTAMKVVSEPSTLSCLSHYKYQLNRDFQKRQYVLNWETKIPVPLGGKSWACKYWISSVHIEPWFKVRIFKNDIGAGDSSLPVRTPSLMGGVSYFGTPFNWWKQQKGKYTRSTYFGVRAYHHSNGQDGEHFDSTGYVQVYNGDFGEQVVFDFMVGGLIEFDRNQLEIRKKLQTKEKKNPPNQKSVANLDPTNYNRLFYWRVAYESHLKKLAGIENTGQDWLKYNLYGRHRVNFQLAYSIIPEYRDLALKNGKYYQLTPYQSKELFRLIFNFKLIVDPRLNVGSINDLSPATIANRINTNLTWHWRITGTRGTGLFAQVGYYGSDNYNIYFQRQFVEFRFGLSYGFFVYPEN